LFQFKKYQPSGNLKFYNLGILKSLKLRILVKKIRPISLKLNFTPNTLGCKGLRGASHFFLPQFVTIGNKAPVVMIRAEKAGMSSQL